METYETSGTVEEQGRILVGGVPFPPGTKVEIAISAILQAKNEAATPEDEALAAARHRLRELFGSIKGFRNSPRIEREELYDRGCFR
jgi:hypothetical protein